MLPITFPIQVVQHVDSIKFIEYWAAQYPMKNESIYQENIRKPLTAERVLALFEWKNSGPMAKQKIASVNNNYIASQPKPPEIGNRKAEIAFILLPGGVIWRIFWLHCHAPDIYPIFDQHVYRAMRYILLGKVIIDPPKNELDKAAVYIDEYLPFHAAFKYPNEKLLDQALWSFGKHIKGKNAV